jgi:serine/threonine-protein kinase RsbW
MDGHSTLERRVATPYVALDLKIRSDIAEVERVVKLASDLCQSLHLPPPACTLNIPVALSEALSNAILRGNKEDPSKHVYFRATVSDKSLVFDVTDEGPGFDIEQSLHDPTTAANIQREDGRGLFLMRELVQNIEVFRTEQGNVVRLTVAR